MHPVPGDGRRPLAGVGWGPTPASGRGPPPASGRGPPPASGRAKNSRKSVGLTCFAGPTMGYGCRPVPGELC
ncbi:unnamed protein product [Linum trigynum]|uniref:Uncharacterized protein n=1 Tax=Linum trigynum TaxID=586398 RepID=A0AAV2CV32_9ROSI